MNKKLLSIITAGAMLLMPVASLAAQDNISGVYVDEVVSGDTMTNNYGEIGVNNGEVTNNNKGVLRTNNGIVITNSGQIDLITANGYVKDNEDLILENSGLVAVNREGGQILTNNDTVTDNYNIIQKNKGTVNFNSSLAVILENTGTVNNNYAKISTNSGTVGSNAGTAIIETNTGTVNNNEGCVANNRGTVNNTSGYVTINFEGGVVNGGRVESNFGGTVGNGATVVTEYHRVIVPENVTVVGMYVVDDVDNNIWVPGGKMVEIQVLPKKDYVITSDIAVSGNPTSAGNSVFTFTNISEDITITATTAKAVDYKIITGDKQTYEGSGNMSFAVSGMREKLKDIAIAASVSEDGRVSVLTPDIHYSTANLDSVGYFTLNESYLKTLANGSYDIVFIYEDGEAVGTFTVAAPAKDEDGTTVSQTEDNTTASQNEDRPTAPQTGDEGAVKVLRAGAQLCK